MGTYIVQTFDGKSEDPELVEMELTQAVQVITPQGTTYAALPAEDGQLIQIVLVAPPVEEEVTTADKDTAYTEEEVTAASAKAGKTKEEYMAELTQKGTEAKAKRAEEVAKRDDKLAAMRDKILSKVEKSERGKAEPVKEVSKSK